MYFQIAFNSWLSVSICLIFSTVLLQFAVYKLASSIRELDLDLYQYFVKQDLMMMEKKQAEEKEKQEKQRKEEDEKEKKRQEKDKEKGQRKEGRREGEKRQEQIERRYILGVARNEGGEGRLWSLVQRFTQRAETASAARAQKKLGPI